MVELLRELFRHRCYSDAAMITAIQRHEVASKDPQLRDLLHHILVAHRFWLHLCQGLPFAVGAESAVPENLDELVQRYRETQAREQKWLLAIEDADLARTLESPYFPNRRLLVREALMQVLLHSQWHLAQCSTRLRALGGEPPSLDYIGWVQEQRGPSWC